MATQTHKVLGKVSANGAIGTYSTLYACPAATQVILSKVVAVNKNAAAQTVRIAIGTTTTTPGVTEWDVYDSTIGSEDSLEIGQGCTLDATNKNIMISASSSDVNFKAYGVEIS